jgi:chromosome segregation ATPase
MREAPPAMGSIKDYKLAEKRVAEQREVISELQAIVNDIERCEKTIHDLKNELVQLNEKHKDRKTTREDIAYLEDLLKCANKKLTWEKHIASLQKRTPETLQRMTTLINDTQFPPDEPTRAAMLQVLQSVQGAMERLHGAKVD